MHKYSSGCKAIPLYGFTKETTSTEYNTAPGKNGLKGSFRDNFPHCSFKMYVLTNRYNRLTETVLMRGSQHIVSFRNRKNYL